MNVSKKPPFNITLLDNNRSMSLRGMLPVTALDIYDTNKEFNTQGLYSVEIFGPVGSRERLKRFSYANLKTKVIHPKIFLDLAKLKGLYKGLLSGTMYAVWDNELKDFTKSDIIDGKTGYAFFMEHFHHIKFAENKSAIRDLRIKILIKFKNNCEYDFVLILPAGLRDIEIGDTGRTTEDDINPIYRKIIRAANTINDYEINNNNPVLDTVRWAIQRSFVELYEYIESIIDGKRGFMMAKYAARTVHRGTRNVITAMDPAPAVLGSVEAVTVNDTIVGLYQYLKSTVELSIYGVRSGPMKPIIDLLPGNINAIDSKTLKSVVIQTTPKIIENWGTSAGIEEAMNEFFKPNKRHKPVYLDGYYAALIYQDDRNYKVIYDIDDLPERFNKELVRPMTWAEMFYLSVYKASRKVICAPTRYPIFQSDGSVYPSFVYLKTTTKSKVLYELDDSWNEIKEDPAIAFPILNMSFFESMNVHPSKTSGLSADKR